jgi:hypothetical protein
VTRDAYAARCAEVRRLIALGEVFEVCLAHVLEAPWEEGGFALFERLLDAAPADHAAYLALGGVELASVSPEVFLRIEDGVAVSRPVKGTRPRGATTAEDDRLAATLAASEKERAENVMIVDLLRNDLTATAEPGSVEVTELCTVERTPGTMHLVSAIRSRVRPEVRSLDVLLSLFPGGSITGRAQATRGRADRSPGGGSTRVLLRHDLRLGACRAQARVEHRDPHRDGHRGRRPLRRGRRRDAALGPGRRGRGDVPEGTAVPALHRPRRSRGGK